MYHNKNLKDKLKIQAYEMIIAEGYECITIRKLGESLGVSSTAIYRHYKNMNELMEQVHELSEAYFAEYLVKDYNDLDELGKMKKMALNFIAFANKESNLFEFMFVSEYAKNMIDIYDSDFSSYKDIKIIYAEIQCIIKKYNLLGSVESYFLKSWSFIFGYAMIVNKYDYAIDEQIIEDMIYGIFEITQVREAKEC